MPYTTGETVTCQTENYSTFTGVLTDTDEIYISIDNPNGDELVKLQVPTHDSAGKYHYNYLLSDSATKGIYTVTWKVIKNTIKTLVKDDFEVV